MAKIYAQLETSAPSFDPEKQLSLNLFRHWADSQLDAVLVAESDVLSKALYEGNPRLLRIRNVITIMRETPHESALEGNLAPGAHVLADRAWQIVRDLGQNSEKRRKIDFDDRFSRIEKGQQNKRHSGANS